MPTRCAIGTPSACAHARAAAAHDSDDVRDPEQADDDALLVCPDRGLGLVLPRAETAAEQTSAVSKTLLPHAVRRRTRPAATPLDAGRHQLLTWYC
jgi:hypothetical protein